MLLNVLSTWNGPEGMLNILIRFIALAEEKCGQQASRKLYQLRALMDTDSINEWDDEFPGFKRAVATIEAEWAVRRYSQSISRAKLCVEFITRRLPYDPIQDDDADQVTETRRVYGKHQNLVIDTNPLVDDES